MMMRGMAAELARHTILINTAHPTTVATEMILNDSTYRLFRPDLDAPGRADFDEVLLSINKLPVAALEASDVTDTVLHLVCGSGRYITGTTQVIDAGGSL